MALPDLTPELTARLASIALGHVTREYPHKVDHVMDGPADVYTPRSMHPVFYGSFDWHSCVHTYWLLARLRRLGPAMPHASTITNLFDQQLTPENVHTELAYIQRRSATGFERPYGWAWLLMLAAELHRDPGAPAQRWSATLKPLSDALVERLQTYFAKLTYPIRAGVHSNTAFALALAAEYAQSLDDRNLRANLQARAEAWFGTDRDAPGWEPSGDDFLSPTLVEAEAMRRLLPAVPFRRWFTAFLPSLAASRPAPLFVPAQISDRHDGKIAHLDGLNLSRAWCWRSLAAALTPNDAARPLMLSAAEIHYSASIQALTEDYMGEHWLASFALLALSG